MADNSQYDDWARHFDNLLWTITAIFLAANGALLVHQSEKANFLPGLAIGGLLLTGVTVYFAASMRELRHRVGEHLDPALRDILEKDRAIYQWQAFVTLFLLFAGSWIWLLVLYAPAFQFWWLVLGVVVVIFILVLGFGFERPKSGAKDI